VEEIMLSQARDDGQRCSLCV